MKPPTHMLNGHRYRALIRDVNPPSHMKARLIDECKPTEGMVSLLEARPSSLVRGRCPDCGALLLEVVGQVAGGEVLVAVYELGPPPLVRSGMARHIGAQGEAKVPDETLALLWMIDDAPPAVPLRCGARRCRARCEVSTSALLEAVGRARGASDTITVPLHRIR